MGKSPRTPSVVFPKIKRADADKDIAHLLKYLINYGFYRFGTEVTNKSFKKLIFA